MLLRAARGREPGRPSLNTHLRGQTQAGFRTSIVTTSQYVRPAHRGAGRPRIGVPPGGSAMPPRTVSKSPTAAETPSVVIVWLLGLHVVPGVGHTKASCSPVDSRINTKHCPDTANRPVTPSCTNPDGSLGYVSSATEPCEGWSVEHAPITRTKAAPATCWNLRRVTDPGAGSTPCRQCPVPVLVRAAPVSRVVMNGFYGAAAPTRLRTPVAYEVAYRIEPRLGIHSSSARSPPSEEAMTDLPSVTRSPG